MTLLIHVKKMHVYIYIYMTWLIQAWRRIHVLHASPTCDIIWSFMCAMYIHIYKYVYIYIYTTWLINVWRCIHVLHGSPTCDIIWSFMCAMPLSLVQWRIHMAHTWNCSTTSIWIQSAHEHKKQKKPMCTYKQACNA